MEILTPQRWSEYELIDSGNREKLERFGKFILSRPEPQAVWSKSLPQEEWERSAHARYLRKPGKGGEERTEGEWVRKPGMPDQWMIGYSYGGMNLRFRLGLTSFGHIGIFPEQAPNWEFIYDHLSGKGNGEEQPQLLNLFAYTGGSSLAARAAGAGVTHVDSVKPVISWAREDMEASGLSGIRWVVEDALKFVRREAKRGHMYDGILLDPPAYGRGPEGEKWILEESIDEMIGLCRQILKPDHGFFILSLYSMGFSSLIGRNLVCSHFPVAGEPVYGEFAFTDRAGRSLPLGTYVRFSY